MSTHFQKVSPVFSFLVVDRLYGFPYREYGCGHGGLDRLSYSIHLLEKPHSLSVQFTNTTMLCVLLGAQEASQSYR